MGGGEPVDRSGRVGQGRGVARIGHTGSDGKRSQLMQRYRTGGTPWVVVIDRDGIVRYNDFHLTPAEGVKLIDRLVAGSTIDAAPSPPGSSP